MALKRMLRPTNRRIRLLVGILLVGLFCVQCTRSTEAFKSSRLLVPIGDEVLGANAADVAARVERLAKSDHIALLEYCLANYDGRFHDYECTFVKQERLRGKLRGEQWIGVKFTEAPFSVAMKWTRNAPAGDAIIYVEGKYDNQMIVRPTSSFLRVLTGGAVRRQPDGPEAMGSTLRPVSMFGLKNSLQNLLKVYRQADAAGDLQESFGGYATVGKDEESPGREAIVLVRLLPAKDDYPAFKTVTYIDTQYLVPIAIEGYGWEKQPQLICRYVYKDLKFNMGFVADDFLPEANDIVLPR